VQDDGFTVFYGTHTGKAKSFAYKLQQEGKSLGFNVNVVNLQELSDDISCVAHLAYNTRLTIQQMSTFSRRRSSLGTRNPIRAIFIISTYGEGSCPTSAARFIYWIKEKTGLINRPEGSNQKQIETANCKLLNCLEYAVFGLGDSRFGSQRYNSAAKKLDSSLSTLGATKFASIGLGDASADLEYDFETWQWKKMWPALRDRTPGVTKLPPKLQPLEGLPFSVEWLGNDEILNRQYKGQVIPDPVITDNIDVSTQHYFYAVACQVIEAYDLQSYQSKTPILHISLDTSCSSTLHKYQTGDHLHILPVNDPRRVLQAASALQLDLDSVFRLQPRTKHFKYMFPTPCTVRDLLSNYCDLSLPPQRSKLKLLSRFATNQDDAAILKRLGSSQGQVEYKKLILERQVGMMDLLSLLFPSIKLPFDFFIAICPRLQPRIFTISSSPSLHPREIHLTVACVQRRTIDGNLRKGVCSKYLQSFRNSPGKICRLFTSPSCFRIPPKPAFPLILIAAGTGISPMRSLLLERSFQKHVKHLPVGPNMLFFGCRDRNLDFLYGEVFEDLRNDGTLTYLEVAFSREDPGNRVYVQNLLSKNAALLWHLIDSGNGYICICGQEKMGQDVMKALVDIFMSYGSMQASTANTYLEKMHSNGRLVHEFWG